MIKIKTMEDLKNLSLDNNVPEALVEKIKQELIVLKEWADEYNEVPLENFDAAAYDYGYIVVFEGAETQMDYQELGLTGGLDNVIPESAESCYIKGDKWTRVIVVYNDSYAMSFWLKNSDKFDTYENLT